MPIIGIDLGTTNSLAAVWRNGKSELIPNGLGEYLTPSAVSLEEDGTVLVGQAAKDRLVSHPQRSAGSFKRLMGTAKSLRLGEREFTPEELSALVLRRLKEDAEVFLGERVEEAVISVPAYFGEAQRAATKRAGLLAGLKVERLVNEPSAAALAAWMEEGACGDGVYLVFDFGGGTLDVSVVDCFNNVVSVVAVSGDNHLGGDDFDRAVAARFCLENAADLRALSPVRRASLIRQAEQCKLALDHEKSSMLTVMGEELSGTLVLTLEKLVECSAELFRRIDRPVGRVLRDSGLSVRELEGIILVGGSCRMPVVRQYLTRLLGREPLELAGPETVVALGAGTYAGIKERREDIRDMVLTDICPFTLGNAIFNAQEPGRDLMCAIIERNSVLPTSKTRRFVTCQDGQTNVEVAVYQGEAPYTEDNVGLGRVQITLPAAPKGREAIDVRFTYDINGLLEVEVTSCTTGHKERALLLSAAGGMTQEEAERRVKELAGLKLHPREREANRSVIAQGERLYQETLGSLREQVLAVLQQFQGCLESQENWKIERARRHTKKFFDQVEGGLTDWSPFQWDGDGPD